MPPSDEEDQECSQILANRNRVLEDEDTCCPNLALPKYQVFIISATWGFLTGIERAIIMPTLWLYFFTRFSEEAAIKFYGVTLAAFNVAIFIISPIYGYLAYKGVRVKALLIISNQLEVIGNIIYFLAYQPWMVLLGRFISGLGAGSDVPVFADIVRITSKEERTKYIVTLLLARQVGLIIGPACTVVMHPLKFDKGTFHLNVYNSPGLFMSILWSLHTVLALLMYPLLDKNGELATNENKGLNKIRNFIYSPQPNASNGSTDKDEKSTDNEETTELIDKNQTSCGKTFTDAFSLSSLRPYTKYQPATILVGLFSIYICLMSLEAVLPPIAERYFKWSDLEISYVFIACGILVVIVYAFLRFLTNHFSDKYLLMFGFIVLVFAYSLETLTSIFLNSNQPTLFISLGLTGVALHVIGLPFVICSESMYTKSIEEMNSDHSQTVLRTVINLAFIIGPFLGGSLQYYPVAVFGLMLLSVVIPAGMLLARFGLFNF